MSADWPVVALGVLVEEITVGFVGSMTHEYIEIGVPFFRSKNISEYEIDWDDIRYISEKFHKKLSKSILKPGDVAVVRTGKPGTTCVIPESVKEANCSDIVIVRVNDEKLSAHYLSYFMNSMAKNQISSHLVGAVQQHFNVGSAKKIEIPLPSRLEQEEIVGILKSLDDKIQLNQEINQTLEQMAQAIFKSWFVDFEPVKAKISALEAGGSEDDALLAAMQVISGKDPQQLIQLQTENPEHYATLRTTAELFPAAMQDSELGDIPQGWVTSQIGDVLERLPVGKKYSQKTVFDIGSVPVLDQGKSGVIGFHDNEPGVRASPENPVIVFANHTCYLRMVMHDFSAIQNVLPFKGKEVNIYWLLFATLGKQSFVEYKGHWPDLIIKDIIVPSSSISDRFGSIVSDLMLSKFHNEQQIDTLSGMRDTLLPKLLSGELSVNQDVD